VAFSVCSEFATYQRQVKRSNTPPCHPDRSEAGFPAKLHWKRPRVRLSVRESRMLFASATKINRKFGVA
jgi:hypothetical protein